MIMNPAIENLALLQFQKDNLEEIDVSAIEQLANKYPYYAPIQYLLAIKYKQMEALLYRLQLPKTAVFFSNPHWLNDLLQSEKKKEKEEDEKMDSAIEDSIIEVEEDKKSNPTPTEEQHDEDPSPSGVAEQNQAPPTINDIPVPVNEPEQGVAATSLLSTLIPESKLLPAVPVEPLFTIDYFASQGIRWSNEEGSDKLSKKLRSFTEWLKTMKRIHPEKLEQEMDKGRDAIIQDIAEHSNEADEVITEAMAEVYARQGLNTKAIEVYQKLSLLNPNKRTYFAARISKLN